MGNPIPKQLTESDVEFELIWEEEYESPSDHLEDPADIQWVVDQDRAGNPWAWFCAHVVARWKGFEGHDYLGACSYRSEAEFLGDAYFADMKAEALAALNAEIAQATQKLAALL